MISMMSHVKSGEGTEISPEKENGNETGLSSTDVHYETPQWLRDKACEDTPVT